MKYYSLEEKVKNNGDFGQISDSLLVEKQSKFYSYIFKVQNEKEALEKIEKIRSSNVQARHVVYIYSLLENNILNIRFSDDGEPKGTGTKAIYELLEKESITNVCIVIVRYFGGILLGAGPLSRAYLNAARDAIENCNKKEIFNYIEKEYTLTYNGYNILKNKVEAYIADETLVILKSEFSEGVSLKLKIIDSKVEEIDNIIKEIIYGSR